MKDLPVTKEITLRAETLSLSASEVTRYNRHILLPEVGTEGQRRLKAARVLIVGTGGLGSPISLYLAAAGVGTLGLVEFDKVDTTNLQRQILFVETDAGRPKLDAAVARLGALNRGCKLEPHAVRLDLSNVEELVKKYDLVVDGTDNFATRYLLGDCCVFLSKPYIYGAIFRFEGQASVFYSPHGPCHRCLFPEPLPPEEAPSCSEAGVLGVLPGQIGLIQASEALKLILGRGDSLIGRLLTFDTLSMQFNEYRLKRNRNCPLCGEHPTIRTLRESTPVCEIYAQPASTNDDIAITVDEFYRLRQARISHVLVDVRSTEEASICHIEGSVLMPMPTLNTRLGELPLDVPIVVHCHSGKRSVDAVRMLRARGFSNTRSLTGGILAWSNHSESSHGF